MEAKNCRKYAAVQMKGRLETVVAVFVLASCQTVISDFLKIAISLLFFAV